MFLNLSQARITAIAAITVAPIITMAIAMSSQSNPSEIATAAWIHTLWFWAYVGLLLLTAVATVLLWRAGNKYQDAIKGDAEARIEEAKTEAAKANEGLAKANADIARLTADSARLNLEVAKAQKETEQERIARLKIEEKVAPRRITKEQQETIAGKLKSFAGQRINVLIYRGDVEAWFIADQIKLALGGVAGAGWIVHSATVTEFNRAISGMMVETTLKADAKGVAAAKALVSVLSAEKLVVSGPSPALETLKAGAFGILDSEAAIQLVVGNKP